MSESILLGMPKLKTFSMRKSLITSLVALVIHLDQQKRENKSMADMTYLYFEVASLIISNFNTVSIISKLTNIYRHNSLRAKFHNTGKTAPEWLVRFPKCQVG